MNQNFSMNANRIIQGDSLAVLKTLPSDSIDCCVTSPPYYQLRDYGVKGQIGREETPEKYAKRLRAVFREVYRVLKPEGTFWLNISDSYWHGRAGVGDYKKKDMVGIPWLLAFTLRRDGWYLRSDIIWVKANTVPESVKDRCTRSYEHVFLLTKSSKYYYDYLAIAEPIKEASVRRMRNARGSASGKYARGVPGYAPQRIFKPLAADETRDIPTLCNKRDVWHINNSGYKGAHFATFPLKLAETCILAGCPLDGIVLDPFFGSGTTGLAAQQSGRRYLGIELNGVYCELARTRIDGVDRAS
jgi:DNA modification methylase